MEFSRKFLYILSPNIDDYIAVETEAFVKSFALGLILILPHFLVAQTDAKTAHDVESVYQETPSVLSWSQAVEYLQKNNAELKASVEALRSAEVKKDIARSGFFPELKGELTWNETALLMTDQNNSKDEKTEYGRSLILSQNLFAGFKDVSKYSQAQAEYVVAQEQLRATKAKLSAELKKAFAGMVLATEILAQTGNIQQRREDNLKIVKLRYDNGREHRGSVLIFEAYLAEAKYDHVEALNTKKIARAQLSQLLGFDQFSDFEIEGSMPMKDPSSQEPDFLKLALSTPEYLQVVAKEEMAREEIQVAHSSHYPSLSLESKISSVDQIFYPRDQERWTIGLKLSIPFFSGGKDLATSRSAIFSAKQAEKTRENTLRVQRAKLQEAYGKFIMGISKLDFNTSYKNAVTMRSEIAKRQYQNGLMGFLDWDWVEGDYVYRLKLYQTAKKERLQAEADWEQAQGLSVIP